MQSRDIGAQDTPVTAAHISAQTARLLLPARWRYSRPGGAQRSINNFSTSSLFTKLVRHNHGGTLVDRGFVAQLPLLL